MKKFGLTLIFIMLVLIAIYFFLKPKANEFAVNDLYDEIVSRGYINVGINVDSKPFGFYDANKNVVGYDADLARYVAQYLLKDPTRVKFIPVTPSNRLLKASTGEVDIVISTVTITPARQEIVDFSVPYDIAGQAILVNTQSEIKSVADLGGQNVGVIFGTTAEKNMRTLVPTANLLGFKSYADAYSALKTKKINAITSDDTILSRYVADDEHVKMLPKRYSREPYGIAFKKGDSTIKLKENLNLAIKDMQEKNIIARIRNKWNVGT